MSKFRSVNLIDSIAVTKFTVVFDDKKTGECAKKLRAYYKKTLRDISDLSGYSISYISDLENGRKKWNLDRALWYQNACKGIKKRRK